MKAEAEAEAAVEGVRRQECAELAGAAAIAGVRRQKLAELRTAEACVLHDLRVVAELAELQQLSTLMLVARAQLQKWRLELKQEIEEIDRASEPYKCVLRHWT